VPRFSSRRRSRAARIDRRRRRVIAAAAGSAAVEASMLWLRTSRIGGNTIVRCRDGHLFTTIWIPGASLKSLRLGGRRIQRCPVGHHWSLVTPVRESELTEEERELAHSRTDTRIP
jgi:hypothetical protein